MQIGRSPRPSPLASDLAVALQSAAEQYGHRPAVTVLQPDGTGGVRREEQGFAGLAQWAAKGAHLLELDLLAEPGDEVAILGPPGWLPVAAVLAAWWAGLAVTDDPADALVVLAHEDVELADRTLGPDSEVLRWGWAPDGAPVRGTDEEAWSSAVQAFPDTPPPPRAEPGLAALLSTTPPGVSTPDEEGGPDSRTIDQTALVRRSLALAGPPHRTLGMQVDLAGTAASGIGWIVAAAARPLATGRATVLLDRSLDREVAAGERVATWLAPEDV